MNWYVKDWGELDREELYDLLILRTAVFVVEQSCPYQEADGLDRRAWHVFAREDGGDVAACLRVIRPEAGSDAAVIGRVVAAPARRGTGLGRELLELGPGLLRKGGLSPHRPPAVFGGRHSPSGDGAETGGGLSPRQRNSRPVSPACFFYLYHFTKLWYNIF